MTLDVVARAVVRSDVSLILLLSIFPFFFIFGEEKEEERKDRTEKDEINRKMTWKVRNN